MRTDLWGRCLTGLLILAWAGQPLAQTPAPPTDPAPAPAPATDPPAPPAQPAQPPASPGTPAIVMDGDSISAILGKSVRSTAGEDMGRIVDVLVGLDGNVRAAVIDFGGFLGVGSRKIAVDWKAMTFQVEGKAGRIILALTRNQVRLSPEYKAGESIVILGVGTPVADAPGVAPPAPRNP